MNDNEIIWMLIDLQYLTEPKDFRKLTLVNKYFYERLKKSEHLISAKQRILKFGLRWRNACRWNRLDHPSQFAILGSYSEIIQGDGTGVYSFTKAIEYPVKRMIAAIWVKTTISNFFAYNPNGYVWNMVCGQRLIDSVKYNKRLDKWLKLEFFKGGALIPVDLFIENCELHCSSNPFADIKVTWVYTNAKLRDIKNYSFEWLNSKNKLRYVNKNRYVGT